MQFFIFLLFLPILRIILHIRHKNAEQHSFLIRINLSIHPRIAFLDFIFPIRLIQIPEGENLHIRLRCKKFDHQPISNRFHVGNIKRILRIALRHPKPNAVILIFIQTLPVSVLLILCHANPDCKKHCHDAQQNANRPFSLSLHCHPPLFSIPIYPSTVLRRCKRR